MAASRIIRHRGVMLRLYEKSIIVEGCSRVLYFRHELSENDIEAVKEVLDSGMEFMARRIQIKQEELTRLIEGGK